MYPIRQKKKSLDFVKSILAFAFSQVGVVVLCVMYAVGGARIYMSMEVIGGSNYFISPPSPICPTVDYRYRLKRRPTSQNKMRLRYTYNLRPEHRKLVHFCNVQAIIAATDYLANSFWDKIHNPNPEKRLNETAYYDKVGH